MIFYNFNFCGGDPMNNQIKQTCLSLRKQVMEKTFFRMNQVQRNAVFQINGPLLILAGAGSGKTTVLVNRIANMIQFGNAYHSQQVSDSVNQQDLIAMEKFLADNTPLDKDVLQKLEVESCAPWQILAITFTNKAAEEIKYRVQKMLNNFRNMLQIPNGKEELLEIIDYAKENYKNRNALQEELDFFVETYM